MTTIVNASIPGTEVRTITAQSNKQEYRISVALPSSYPAYPERSYPTIYLPDAYFYFGMVTELTRVMVLCGEFPETIVVGIGYPLHEPLEEVTKEVRRLRIRDLTPVPDPLLAQEDEESGGAPAFLTFIKAELIPLIEREYRADAGARVLAGHSAGGLFALYVLFHQPDLFAGYSVASVGLDYSNKVTFAYEEAFAEGRTSLPLKLHFGIGDHEEPGDNPMDSDYYRDFFQLIERLESRKYEGLSLTKHIAQNCNHCGSTAPTFQAGLQAVLSEHANL
jgi:predicted alpha/beta superfamily hydrolase